jgi:hypothetical protein
MKPGEYISAVRYSSAASSACPQAAAASNNPHQNGFVQSLIQKFDAFICPVHKAIAFHGSIHESRAKALSKMKQPVLSPVKL